MGFETHINNCFECWYKRYHEAVPMGFETVNSWYICHFLKHHEAVPMGFETIYLKIKADEVQLSWSSPYGIWNTDGLAFNRMMEDHEAVPMGFETKVKIFCFTKLEQSWSSPYGIWNGSREKLQDFKNGIMKQSLWDLKPPSFVENSFFAIIMKQSLWDLKQYFWG